MSLIHFGIDRTQFFNAHYQSGWWLKRQVLSENSLSWKHIDQALYAMENANTQIKLFKDGPVEPGRYTEPYWELGEQRTRIVKDILYRYLTDGATLVLNKLQLYLPEINDYCMDVAQFVGEKTNANAYAAFGGDGSFGKHWDTHDVFALQLIGRKRWRLYQPTFELPLNHQTSLNHKAECPTEPVLDTVLAAGDLLYIPRGWWHEALPIPGDETFHIAIGTFPPKLLDYLLWLCGNQLPDRIESRRSINPYLNTTGLIERFTPQLQSALAEPENLHNFYIAYTEQQRVKSRFNIGSLSPTGISDNTALPRNKIRINSFLPISNDQKTLLANGFKINLDTESADFLAGISSADNSPANKSTKQLSDKENQLLKKLSTLDLIERF
ncbi:cupin domain-containing protein [Methylomonas fluvii]|uniref:Cupin-like domain-containing protein n=1 Tax=Methylomonas fluvii TaxID=1854564 RepID=A0ABR9DMG0_9GAMM|nr:cupin domain-containing protein [Methylomonas fluvii]MBD9363429.1 cupin-like domain-containing protein [Methylomonas fluvii]